MDDNTILSLDPETVRYNHIWTAKYLNSACVERNLRIPHTCRTKKAVLELLQAHIRSAGESETPKVPPIIPEHGHQDQPHTAAGMQRTATQCTAGMHHSAGLVTAAGAGSVREVPSVCACRVQLHTPGSVLLECVAASFG
jgi:hypothetical protein